MSVALRLLLVAFLLALPDGWQRAAQAATLEPKTLGRAFDPIEINGSRLEAFLGKPFDRMQLLAQREGRLEPAPYQFDERTPDGAYVLPEGPQGSSEGATGTLEPQDILVFMVSDAGDKLDPATLGNEFARLEQITLVDPVDGGRAWVYLALYEDAASAPPVAFEPKVRMIDDPDAYRVKGTSYDMKGFVNEIGGRIYRTGINNSFSVPASAGGIGRNLLDRMKTRVVGHLLFGAVRIRVNENNVIGGIEQFRRGPVRGYGRNWLQMEVPVAVTHLRSPKMYLDVFCYDTFILIPMRIHVAWNPRIVGVYGSMSYGYDMNPDAYGMLFFNSENREGFVIDGRMSPQERHMNPAVDEWRVVTGPQGTMITRSVWDPSYVKLANIAIHYIDDLSVKVEPEDIPGQIGYHHNQSESKAVRPGTYDSLLCWYFPPHFYQGESLNLDVIQAYADVRDRPVEIRIGGRSFRNPGGWPDPIVPHAKDGREDSRDPCPSHEPGRDPDP